VNPIIKGLTRE